MTTDATDLHQRAIDAEIEFLEDELLGIEDRRQVIKERLAEIRAQQEEPKTVDPIPSMRAWCKKRGLILANQ
jgi:hypothetical protein